jgi:MYXO-CTERM domain-containing protein
VSVPVSCDDGNACTADACDATTGCRHTLLPACLVGDPGALRALPEEPPAAPAGCQCNAAQPTGRASVGPWLLALAALVGRARRSPRPPARDRSATA